MSSAVQATGPAGSVMDNIVVGQFYELPDGKIARLFGANGPSQTVRYYFDDAQGERTAHASEISQWVRRPDLADFPNARDPRLPYVFDLFWDLKYLSCLREELEGHSDEAEIRAKMAEHNIKL